MNAGGEQNIEYDHEWRRILKHIEWDEPKIPKWK